MTTLAENYSQYHRTGFKKSQLFPKIEATIYQHLGLPSKKELATIIAIAYYSHTDNTGRQKWSNLAMLVNYPEWAYPAITRWVDSLLKKPNQLAKYKRLYEEEKYNAETT